MEDLKEYSVTVTSRNRTQSKITAIVETKEADKENVTDNQESDSEEEKEEKAPPKKRARKRADDDDDDWQPEVESVVAE